jgi:hypothetical protein
MTAETVSSNRLQVGGHHDHGEGQAELGLPAVHACLKTDALSSSSHSLASHMSNSSQSTVVRQSDVRSSSSFVRQTDSKVSTSVRQSVEQTGGDRQPDVTPSAVVRQSEDKSSTVVRQSEDKASTVVQSEEYQQTFKSEKRFCSNSSVKFRVLFLDHTNSLRP